MGETGERWGQKKFSLPLPIKNLEKKTLIIVHARSTPRNNALWEVPEFNAAFKLASHLPHCHFDDNVCTTVQAPLATEVRPNDKYAVSNQSITSLLCPNHPVDYYLTWKGCRSALGDKAKAA